MERLEQTVREISEASKGIHKVLKAIEDIAFQTNILALNASVEAARAGALGKGFSVVADEVRSLAAKSSDAAKETAALVEISNSKAAEGEALAGEVSAAFLKIMHGITQSDEVILQIEKNSRKNNGDVTEMNRDVGMVSEIVQKTSASTHETAMMAQELSKHAESLNEIVSMFRIKETEDNAVTR
jgi:methyl-accepting chemotaxis protein